MFHTTKLVRVPIIVSVLAATFFCFGCESKQEVRESPLATSQPSQSMGLTLVFDDVPVGRIVPGWNVEATRQDGPLATWAVVADATAPSGGKVLALTKTNHNSGGTFNLCWTDKISFLNGEISVRFKANTGEEDQGGGVIWRAQDKDNYLIARFNPLEDNFRIYTVLKGRRRTLASAKIALAAGKWHTLKITQEGNVFAGYLNGEKLLEGSCDVFPNAGGVGLWTKADAVTSFDNFTLSTRDK